MRVRLPLLLALVCAACGGRTPLRTLGNGATTTTAQGAGGAGGAGGGSVTSGSASSVGGGSPVACDALTVLDPILTAPIPPARSPEIGLLPSSEDVFLAFVEAPNGTSGLLRAGRMAAFSTWPPALTDLTDLDMDVLDLATGPGPTGPVALLRHGAGDASFLATTFLPQMEGISLGAGSDAPLFVTAIPDRYFAAQVTETPAYDVLGVGSYQPGSLAQTEEPLVCITSRMLGAGVPSGSGFIAAFVAPNPPEPSCDSQSPKSATVVSVARYDAPPGTGPSLERLQGALFVGAEPIANLGVAPASFGAWVVFQTDGSTSRASPAVLAAPVDSNGQLLQPNDSPFPVSPDGVTQGPVAVAALGDTLAVAWIESIDPSAPTIVIQLVHPDGSLGGATSISTNEPWFSGHLRMQGSADGRSLLVAWEGGFADARIGLARVDCVGD